MSASRALAAMLVLGACGSAPLWVGRSVDRVHRATITEDGARVRLSIDLGATRTYDAIAFDRIAWTSRDLLAPAQRDGAWWMIDGAIDRGPFVAIGDVLAAGDHTLFAAERADGWHVTRDGHEGDAFEAIEPGALLDPDHGSAAYVITRGGHEHAVHDDALGPPCERVATLTLGAKGRMLAYLDRGARDRLLVDHREVATYDRVLELVVAREEPHWAALVAAAESTLLVHDGATLANAPFFTHLRISDDGAHVSCLSPAADGASIDLVVDGAHVAHHRRIDGDRLAFVPGDARVVFVWEDSQGLRITLDGRESDRYESIEGPTLASHRAGWVARRAEQSEVIIEGETIATEEWAGTLVLASRGDGYAYVARVGRDRFVVTSRGRWAMPRFFVDTLVLDDEGRHFAALVPDSAAHALSVWIDGVPAVTLDEHELGGAIAIEAGRAALGAVVRGVVRAERARARHDSR